MSNVPYDAVIYESEAVDALTLTSKSVVGRALLASIYNRFAEEKNTVAYQKEFKALGYKGYQCGSVRWGSRLDGSAMFTSGDDAMYITHMLVNDYDFFENLKTTRVDICLDVAMNKRSKGWLRTLRDSKRFQEVQGRANRQHTLIESVTGDTLYIGARTSGRFGRIYDKSEFYGLDLGWVYRFEIETKKQVAPAIFKRVINEQRDGTYEMKDFKQRIRAIIKTQFSNWGVYAGFPSDKCELVRAEKRVSTVDTQLEWLSRSVKPVVEKLVSMGYRQQAFDAVGVLLETFPE